MPDVVNNVLAFLINTLIDIYLIVLLLRILLAAVRADFYNPLSQLIVTLTDPLLRPLQRAFPAFYGIDSAAMLLLVILKIVQLMLLALVAGLSLTPVSLLAISVVQLLELLIWIYIISIIALAIMSWFHASQGRSYHPVFTVLQSITRPVLDPLRRIIPATGMMDLSPLVAVIILNVLLVILRSL